MERKERTILLWDGDGMDGELVTILTDAPVDVLKNLEIESNKDLENGDNAPSWVEVLQKKGYTASVTDSCSNMTPYTSSREWKKEHYKGVDEVYSIKYSRELERIAR